MNDWSARQYLKFEDDRTRPSRDLLAQVPLDRAERVFDLGCGPGNSTELLIERFPHAEVIGLDSSSDMLRQARERLPGRTFVQGELATWNPPKRTNLLFANAVFQWVPDHPAVLMRLLNALPSYGVLAVQMPDNTNEPALALMREVTERGPYAATRHSSMPRAVICRRQETTTICCGRSPAISTSGTSSTITSWPARRRSSSRSRARRCGHSSTRSTTRRERLPSPTTLPGSPEPIRPATMARSCFDSRACSSSHRDSRALPVL